MVVSGAVAQEGGGGKPGGQGGPGGMQGGMSPTESEGFRVGMVLEQILGDADLVQKVGLTEEQVKTLNATISELKKEKIKLRAEMDLASVDQADKMAQSTIDEKEVMKTVEKVGEIRTKLAKIWLKELIIVKKTLTPEQIKKIKQVAKELRKEHRGKDGGSGDQKGKDQGSGQENTKQ
jgi:Spy/CpxP family protein refolding chaperone